MQDGSLDLGTMSVPFQLGTIGTILTQNFDSVTAPALPAGWTAQSGGIGNVATNWYTTNTLSDTTPNAVFSRNPANVSSNILFSPVLTLPPSGTSQLTFRQRYDMEDDASNQSLGYDGGVLEIKINAGPWQDITNAGGTFVSGGYNRIIDTGFGSPLAGRPAWSGTSNSYYTVLVNLPPTAAGQNVQLRWFFASDNGQGAGGWRIDSIGVKGQICCANSPPILANQTNRTVSELVLMTVTNTVIDPGSPNTGLIYTLAVTNVGNNTVVNNASISASGVITWTPTEVQGPSTNLFTTVVFNTVVPSLAATNSFTVIVNDVNSAPILPTINAQTVPELGTLIVTNTATDTDIPPNTLSYSLINPPANASISAQGVITFTPNEAQGPSTNTITTVCTDGTLSTTNSFTVTVTEVNTPPGLPSISQRTIVELTTLIVTNTASDGDIPANTLVYNLLNPPANVGINAQGIITFTPSEAQGPSTNTIVTVVSDGVASATNSFVVIVTETNSPPLLPAITNQTVAELSTLSVTNTATDSDLPANTLTYTLQSPPANVSIDAQGVITFTPGEAQGPSTNTITTVVSDGTASATNSFTVVVTEVNSPPSLPVIGDQTVAELSTLTVTNTASDSDVPANTLSYTLLSPPANASISSQGVVTFTPSEAQGPSTNTITTVVSDGSASATNSFLVIVTEVNLPPSLPVISQQTVAELATMIVTNAATDSDLPANTLSYSLANPPANVSIDAQGVITFTPNEAQGPSTNTITTIVSDGSASATNSFTVIVTEVNTPPSLGTIGQQTIAELSTLIVTNTATDSDVPANTLTYSLLNPPANASISSQGVVTFTPSEAQGPSTNTITTVVSDGTANATNSFTVVVTEVNEPPTLPVIGQQTIAELSTLVVTNTATDPDVPANTLTYSLLDPPANANINSQGIITFTPNTSQGPSTNTITTVVSDGTASATNSFTVIVTDQNTPPILPVISDQTIAELNTLTVTNTATDADVPTNTLTYTLINPPANASIDSHGVITFSPSEAQGPSTNIIKTVVSDGQATATNTFTVFVTEVNSTPSLPVVSDRIIAELTTLTVTNVATDSDLPANTLTYSLLNPPANASISAQGVITFTPSEAQGPSTNTITTIVSDGSASATNSFTVLVTEVNTAPSLPVVGQKSVVELSTLTVTNTATDADLPANTLSYSLAATNIATGLPITNANISAAGVITWTPATGQGPSTNQFITIVSDNGSPNLHATNSFIVVVLTTEPEPQFIITSITISNDVAIVKWNSTTGETYRLRYKENVVDLNWTTSSPDITATGSTASANDVFGNSPMRFYQVEHVAPTNGPAPGTVNFDTAPAPGDSDAAPASGSSGVSNAQNVESYATATAQRFYRSGFAP